MNDKNEMTTESSSDNKLIHAGQELGKAIARSTFQAEQTGKKIKKKMEETVSRLGSGKSKKEPKTAKSLFTDEENINLTDKMGFVAGEIFNHLSLNGETTTEKLVKTITSHKYSNAMVFCAIGWLAREGKIALSPDGAFVSLKPE